MDKKIDMLYLLLGHVLYIILFLLIKSAFFLSVFIMICSIYFDVKIFDIKIYYPMMIVFSAFVMFIEIIVLNKYCKWEVEKINPIEKDVEYTYTREDLIELSIRIFVPLIIYLGVVIVLGNSIIKKIAKSFEPLITLTNNPHRNMKEIFTYNYWELFKEIIDILESTSFRLFVSIILFIPIFSIIYKSYKYLTIRRYMLERKKSGI